MFTYSTTKIVQIPSKILTIIYYIILIAILGYIAVYGLWISKGYQVACPVESVVTTKVKGTVSTLNVDSNSLKVPARNVEYYKRIWDAQDIVTPAHGGENGGLFVMTNILLTPNQTRGVCAENPKFAPCTGDRNCVKDEPVKNGNGVMNGKCVPHGKVKTCEIYAWCPVEDDLHKPFEGNKALLMGTQDFTVLIKNTIDFPAFGVGYRKRNIEDTMKEEYLQNCIHDPKKDPYCPTFRIGDIVKLAGHDYGDVALTGGIFAVVINWDCSFDWGRTIKDCKPKYTFSRMDNAKTKISPGWNFRSVSYHDENRRTLTQRWGIKILIEVEGEGKRFDSIKFLLTVGAGLGFFALASFVCDYLLSLFSTLRNYVSSSWLAKFDEEMKYDLQYVKQREYRKANKEATSNHLPTSEL